jgi:4-hydroxymandelate oxidase
MTSTPAPGEARPPEPISLDEYEAAAEARLPGPSFDYLAGGAADEQTLRRNRTAWGHWLLRPRALRGVAEPDLATTVLGQAITLPVLLAPTAMQRLAHPEGERAAARAAAAAGTIYVAATLSTCSLEEIAAAAAGRRWFQLYALRDRRLTELLVRRAETTGYQAICLTIDVPAPGRRERDLRNRFSLPPGLTLANFHTDAGGELPPMPEGAALIPYIAAQIDPLLSWDDLPWIRSLSRLPLVIKGIMTREDAERAVHAGAVGVVVSNHAGRQLDSAPAGIEVLQEVVDAVQGRCEVYVDGGVRRGTDVLKALALGARAVLIGRPYLWGLAVDGEAGARRVLDLLAEELRTAMILCSCPDARSVDPRILMPSGREP